MPIETKKPSSLHRKLLFAAVASALSALPAAAQARQASPKQLDNVKVVGSQIADSGAGAALPVIALDKEQLSATGATDGNELIRSLPQMGDITWNPTWLGGGSSNAARGDMGSINLKNLGASNTLLLINGRRSVIHPTTATVDGGISTTSYNSNAIPMFGLQGIDLLMDGAAAIYGSDAIAGVVNLVTLQNLADGGAVQLQYGQATGTHREDSELSGYFGHDFAEGRGNVSVMYDFSHRTPQYVGDEWYTATDDHRGFLRGTDLEGASSLDGRSTSTPWGRFQAITDGGDATIRLNGAVLANAAGHFHTQPDGNAGCVVALGNGACIDDGSADTSGADRNLRYDSARERGLTASPRTDRGSFFSNFRYSINDDLEFFGEAAYYYAKTRSVTSSSTTSTTQPITIPASAYWNPLGALRLADGSPNPNRLAGLDGVPDEGLPIGLSNYRLADGGTRQIKVTNMQNRFLGGLRGWTDSGLHWESALLYSRSRAIDDSEGYSVSGFIDALSGTTAGAYNPFNGGDPANPSLGDASPNSAATIDAFKVWTRRTSTAELALWDFKVDKSDLFSLPAGDVGAAAGVEVRYESLKDDRDPLVDGSGAFTDPRSGQSYDSNLLGTSATPDSYGSRNVKSAYLEFAVPIVSPDFGIPLIKSIDLQIAGRYEKYSDVGDIAKPKVALAWAVSDSLLLRGSWSEGFKAPNLELVNSASLTRFNTFTDYIRCEADARSGAIGGYADCSENYSVQSIRTGNRDLAPETSTNYSAGLVFEPKFIPERFGSFSFSADWWKIKIDNPIGMLTDDEALMYDLYQRVVNGSRNPNVVRAEPNAEDVAQFAGTGLAPVGEILHVDATYDNLAPLKAEGLDLAASWRMRGTRAGDFQVNLNATRLLHYQQSLTDEMAAAKAAQDAGLLDGYLTITSDDQVGKNGAKPEWKASGTVIWKLHDFTTRIRGQYVGSLDDGSYASGLDYRVDSTLTWNTSFRYDFTHDLLHGFSVELGARNVFDKAVPLNAGGNYLASLYQPYGRYVYFNVQKSF